MRKLPFDLIPYTIKGGSVETTDDGTIKLEIPSNCKQYTDAQVDDYHTIPREQFLWSPPCHFEIRARASSTNPPGTLGFGLWNDPFTLSMGQGGAARRFPATPQSLWFFYGSKENDIRLDPDLPGYGWKASSIRSPQLPLLLVAPLAAMAIGISHIPVLRSIMMKLARRIISVDEAMLGSALDQWHTYRLDWNRSQAVFFVDGRCVNKVDRPPSGPLGFVAWIDNQYAVASHDRSIHFGVIQTHSNHWLEIEFTNLTSP
jgi:hypothetical protein